MSVEHGDRSGLILAVDRLALPSTTDGILRLMRSVLGHALVQSVEIRIGEPVVVTWYRRLHALLELDDKDTPPHELLGVVPVEEFHARGELYEQLGAALQSMSTAGLWPAVLLVGSLQYLKAQVNTPSVTDLFRVEGTPFVLFAGLKAVEVADIPEDCAVLIGTDKEAATMREAAASTQSRGYRLLL